MKLTDALLACPECQPIPEWDWLEARGLDPQAINYGPWGAVCILGAADSGRTGVALWRSPGAEPEIVHDTPVRLLLWWDANVPVVPDCPDLRGSLVGRACAAPPERGWGLGRGGVA